MKGVARLFFAAWPTPDIQRELGEFGRALQRECGGRALPARNIHLTLLRSARRAPGDAAMRAVAWPVSRFALVESVPRVKGRSYEVMREWSLGMKKSA